VVTPFDIQSNVSTNALLTCDSYIESSVSTNVPIADMGAMFSADIYGSQLLVTAIAGTNEPDKLHG